MTYEERTYTCKTRYQFSGVCVPCENQKNVRLCLSEKRKVRLTNFQQERL